MKFMSLFYLELIKQIISVNNISVIELNLPVKRYLESMLKAQSQTQRCVSCRSSRIGDQSLVFHTFAEQSPDVVTNILTT